MTLATLLFVTSLALATGKSPTVAVMSLGSAPDTPAFVESLRIQLTGLASVTAGFTLADGSRKAKLARAQAFLATSGASIAVWQEQVVRADGPVVVVVLAITRETSSAIEVARLPLGTGLDDERVLALKVGELLYRVLSAAKSEQELADALMQGASTARPATDPRKKLSVSLPAPRSASTFRGFSEIGGFFNVYSTSSPSPPGAKFALGAAYETPPFRAEGYAGLRVLGELSTSTPKGRVSLHEYDLAAGLRALFLADSLRWGLAGEFSANVLRASGSTPDGREGSAWLTDYSVALGPEARLRLLPILEMRAFFRAQTRLTSERFAVEEVLVNELSGVRMTGEISLVFWTP